MSLGFRQKLPLFLLVLWLIGSLLLPIYAAADDGYVIRTEEEPKTENVLVGQLQDRLTELGYYSGNRTLIYDADTQYAVYSFCMKNGLSYPTKGVTEALWDSIRSPSAISAADSTAAYTDIAPGSSGDAVLALQTRLKELLYYTRELTLTPGVYDEDTQQAVALFCASNNIAYNTQGASAALQQILFSEGAVPYEEDDSSVSEKMAAYMLRKVSMLGVSIPMFFIWIVSAVLIVLILVLCIYFFVPGEQRSSAPLPPPAGTPRHWRKNLSDEQSSSALSQKMMHGSYAGHTIHFQINYRGNIRNEQRHCNPSLSIGRSCGDLPLDASDGMVSRSHCDLYYKGAVLMLVDHSSNGTLVNGNPIHNCECRINSGDTLIIGSHQMSLQF